MLRLYTWLLMFWFLQFYIIMQTTLKFINQKYLLSIRRLIIMIYDYQSRYLKSTYYDVCLFNIEIHDITMYFNWFALILAISIHVWICYFFYVIDLTFTDYVYLTYFLHYLFFLLNIYTKTKDLNNLFL